MLESVEGVFRGRLANSSRVRTHTGKRKKKKRRNALCVMSLLLASAAVLAPLKSNTDGFGV